jgi:hypothetical protein
MPVPGRYHRHDIHDCLYHVCERPDCTLKKAAYLLAQANGTYKKISTIIIPEKGEKNHEESKN